MNKKLLITVLIFFLAFLSCSKEKDDWKTSKSKNTIRAYEDFLEHHPNSDYAGDALSKLEELYFKKAESQNTIQAYEDFLNRYPQGLFAEKAQIIIERLYYEEAEIENTILTYRDYLNKFPKASYKKKARARIEKLRSARHQAFRNAETVKILVKQSYGEAGDINLPFEKLAKRFFEYAGFKIVSNDAKDFDFTFKIQAKGRPLGAAYANENGSIRGYLYTGASISGTFTLEIPVKFKYTKSFGYHMEPELETRAVIWETLIENANLLASNAPFNKVFNKSDFLPKFIEMIRKIFGISPLIAGLKDSLSVIDELVNVGKPAIEPLINALKSKDLRRDAAFALYLITGEQFYSENYRDWSRWWKQNKEKLLKEK